MTPDPVLRPGDQVDRYVVLGALGEGGMASVFLVQHRTLETRHAMKVLTLRSPTLDARFVQEGKVQARLDHPNIVGVSDVLTLPVGPALLMDYVDGPPLDVLLANHRLSTADALEIFRQLLHGVAHAHAAGIVHRDLKPANVLLALEDGGVRPRIADFGLAKVAVEDGGLRHTRSGATMGTPTYMAEEQIADAGSADARSDLYSLGVMLYEFFCGQVPYVAENLLQLVTAKRQGAYPPPRTLAPDIPARVVRVLDALLDDDPDARFPSAADTAAALGWMEPAGTVRPPIGGELHRVCADLASAAPHAALLTSPIPTAPSDPMPTASTADGSLASNASWWSLEATPPRRSRRVWVAIALGVLLLSLVLVVGVGAAGLAMWTSTTPDLPTTELPPPPGRRVDTGVKTPAVVAPAPEPPAARPGPRPAPAVRAPAPAPAPQPAAPEPAAPEPAAPEPAAPEPAAPEPAAVPTPAPAAPTVTFSATGADRVWLRSGGRDIHPGQRLEAGTYTIHAIFDGAAPVSAGNTTATGDVPMHIRCDASWRRCTAEETR